MKIHAAALALLLVPAYADAQSSARTAPARPAAEEHQAAKPPTGEITLIGCVQREAAYRQAEHAAKGGPLHSGLGQGNEFVLTDARPIPAGKSAVGTSGGSGRAFMLTGKIEKGFADAVGRQVEVVGTLHEVTGKKEGELPNVTVSVWHPVGDFCPAK